MSDWGDKSAQTSLNSSLPTDQVAVIVEALKREQRVSDDQRETITALKEKLGVTEAALLRLFRILGEADVAVEQQAARLLVIAEDFKRARDQAVAAPGEDPAVVTLKDAVQAALDAGELEQADALLEQVLAAQDAAADRRQLEAAATSARRGDIALSRLRYREAAAYFGAAAQRVPPGHAEHSLAYRDQQAAALYRQGDEFGDNEALASAIVGYRALLQARERVPLDWAATQNNLGTALARLGERESGTARLEAAVSAYRAALEEYTRERVPLDWAATQNNLGNALASLGERESGTARLEAAVAAWAACLTVTASVWPVEWILSVQTRIDDTRAEIARRMEK